MYPGCEKVDPKVTAKTSLECISDLIKSERDLSLFTKFFYSRYSIKDTQKVIFLIEPVCFYKVWWDNHGGDHWAMELTIKFEVGCRR